MLSIAMRREGIENYRIGECVFAVSLESHDYNVKTDQQENSDQNDLERAVNDAMKKSELLDYLKMSFGLKMVAMITPLIIWFL
jgi:hypothetical protein